MPDWRERIWIEPGKKAGKPVIRGYRIGPQDVFACLAEGMSTAEILTDFPYLEPGDIEACLGFVRDGAQLDDVPVKPAGEGRGS